MKFHPILFSTEMVKAILDGRKTMTRREMKPQPTSFVDDSMYWINPVPCTINKKGFQQSIKSPYGIPGDVMWVRESWQQRSEKAMAMGFDKYFYKAGWEGCTEGGWKPSIHMPKTACRIFLQIKSIKVEELHDISEADSIKEGVEEDDENYYKDYTGKFDINPYANPFYSFMSLWTKLNGEESWFANPWVWVIEFQRIEKPATF